ncbi:MAG TPA: DUF1540 domain-containing protein [Symbiobacteriaceae bacterium]|nr:DUF1540 domain-containing protein [Symbiobacteriaceae bacterium]
MPKLEVYCTVNNCDYWGKNNHCLAEKLLIVVDEQAAAWPDGVDAPDGAQLENAQAETCMQTACKTFRPRYSHAGPVKDQRNTDAYLEQKFPHH